MAAVCLTVAANAQDFPGYRAGNYTGVNGVFFNPANIADSRYRVDFNLFSIHLGVGNDQASFKLKDQFKNFDTDSLKNQVFGNNAGAASGLINATIHGPSLMFALGPKAGIALTTRARVMANIRDMDGKLVDKIVSDFENDPDLPYTFSSNEDMQFAVNGWTEFGFSFAHVLMDQKTHFLKGGFTAKYLAGAANGYVNLGNLNGTIIEDANNPYLTNSTGRLGMGFGGVNIGDFEAGDLLKMESTGYGGDIGFVYEFRPNHEKFVYGEGQVRRDVNKYKLRLGVALTDIGSINYKRDVNRSG
ncbi:MAG TPA: DUF5723 family protein [Parasegetibacter sp.]